MLPPLLPHSLTLSTAIALLSATLLHADWRTDIGYDRLLQLIGPELPNVPAEGLSHIEALDGNSNYSPNQTLPQFSDKIFVQKSGPTNVSSHANLVAIHYYSSTVGLFTGNASIDLYSAGPWLDEGFLKTSSMLEPAVETRAVQNHSWISTPDEPAFTEDAIRRLDYAINRDGFSCVVGVNNGSSTNLPDLLAHSYHSIAVGLTSGNHSSGTTTLDGPGRTKPDIVAPSSATSFATPMVSASAALLHSALGQAPYSLSGATRTRTIKALLMASARKDTVQESGGSTWVNSPTAPLDATSGAGELNIFLAYKTLRAGPVSSSSTTSYGTHGWSAEELSSSSSRPYFFTIPAGSVSPPVSALLTWHRVIEDGTASPESWRDPSSSLADLNLKLHQANGTVLGSEINSSHSAVDNVELIHLPSLSPGDYAWVVESSSSISTPYSFAWQTVPAVSITATDSIASEIDSSTGEVTITRSDDTTLPLLVGLSFSGTATAELDYIPIATSIIIPAGQSSVTVPVTPITNDTAEGDRTLTIQLTGDFTYTHDTSQIAEVTIEDKPFDRWRSTHFNITELADPTISSPNADPDGDALANLIEYSLGQNPREFSTSSLFNIEPDGRITIRALKNPAATDLVWSAEDSADLVNWNTADIITNSATLFQAHDTSTNPGEDKRFIRLKITRP